MADPTEAEVNAAADAMVRELFGRTCRVGSMHREVARTVLVAAAAVKPAEQPGRDGESTLSSSTERAAQPTTYNAAQRIKAGEGIAAAPRFGFGQP